ncbi:MAG: hypothetical protein Ct9H300mP14_05990 [Gammaproteobacteria bacterium]|nr:MAG: hypothetical protein Ct9H300mP14_05990 [Gammaproteobacteria bacterium]
MAVIEGNLWGVHTAAQFYPPGCTGIQEREGPRRGLESKGVSCAAASCTDTSPSENPGIFKKERGFARGNCPRT